MYYRNFLIIFLSTVLVACGAGETRKLTTEEIVYGPRDKARLSQIKEGGTFLEDLFKGDDNNETGSGSFVSYNNPLWKASLEVLSSFPLVSVDAKSGLIITDWYTSEKKPSERFKITVLILAPDIQVDSVKVSVHKQVIKKNRWVNRNINSKKPVAIERQIIQRAIELNL
ncbi:MAG: hypothetical protein CFH34_00324 [Alphaproteobacteria bacterium MarineAlpha9_Bin4]|nr:hypothetical protein [Pelagibacterales bacterium]PPR27290.1 MAG: hypothetical protein CFH34_00324 [Alphaproteobacteria bacterium MarineAlpha9_Bin4]|tara:strand:- start:1812 stop:2321 length:510 start_codon:yes stop_codon:yes gene_type:complete